MATTRISELPTIIPTSNTLFVVARDDISYNVTLNVILAKLRTSLNSNFLKLTAPATENQVLAYNNGSWAATSPDSLPNYPVKNGVIASLFAPHKHTAQFATAVTKAGEVIAWGYMDTPLFDNYNGRVVPSQARRVRFYDTDYTDYLYNNPGVTVLNLIRGNDRAIALLSDGTVWLTGYGSCLGLGSDFNSAWTYGFRKITFSDGAIIKSIHTGGSTEVAVDETYGAISTTNNLYLWGYNGAGQLGTGDTTAVTSPRKITDSGIVNNVKTVMLGGSSDSSIYGNTVIVTLDGYVWVAGYNGYGQLGLGHTNNTTVFAQAKIGTNVFTGADKIGESDYGLGNTVFIIKADKTVWACGRNNSYQLGDKSTQSCTTFQQVPGLSNIVKLIHSGRITQENTCIALNSFGAVYTWGYNYYGSCGINSADTFVKFPTMVNDRDATNIYVTPNDAYHVATGFLRNKTLYVAGPSSWGGSTTASQWNAHMPLPVKNVVDAQLIPGSGGGWIYNYGSLLLTEEGDVYGVGAGQYILFGSTIDNTSASSPIKLLIK